MRLVDVLCLDYACSLLFDSRVADVSCSSFIAQLCCRESTGLGGPLNVEEFHVIQGMTSTCAFLNKHD
jgi:hypothetical protein